MLWWSGEALNLLSFIEIYTCFLVFLDFFLVCSFILNPPFLPLFHHLTWNFQVIHESKSLLTRWRHRLLRHCSRCSARKYINPIPVYYLPRLRAENVYRFNERKQFQAGKEKRQKILSTNYYGCGLHWWQHF